MPSTDPEAPRSSGGEIEHRIEAALACPAAAGLFVLADREGITGADLGNPAIALQLAAEAAGALTPWGEPANTQKAILKDVRRLEPLIRAVLADRRNGWWFSSFQGAPQLRYGTQPAFRTTPQASTPSVDAWEVYAQRPAYAVQTSTELAVPAGESIRSSLLAEFAQGASDLIPTYPLAQQHLHIKPAARVFEIASAQDWHRLVLQYGDLRIGQDVDKDLPLLLGADPGPAPHWDAVSADWDGVHMSFWGLLTTLNVPVKSNDVTTTMWTWNSEQTYWLRDVFASVENLQPLTSPPPMDDFFFVRELK